jgi:hypothetical protein
MGLAFDITTMDVPFGHAGESRSASSPGSSTQRMLTLRAWTPEAEMTMCRAGSSSTPCSSW